MFQQVIPRSFLWVLVSLWAVLIIGITGCDEGGGGFGGGYGYEDVDNGGYEDVDNDWGGTWELTTVDGQRWAQFLAEDGVNVTIIINSWRFYNDGSLKAEVVFELEPEVVFELEPEDKPDKITISNEAVGNYSLTDSIYTLKFEGTDFFKDSTGTWSSTRRTLTLKSDEGSTVRFEKK